MDEQKSSASNAIGSLKKRVKEGFKPIIWSWVDTLQSGAFPYGRVIGPETTRLYLNSFVLRLMRFLDNDCENLYQATLQAIDSCKPEQYSTKKHTKEAAVSLAKYLVYKAKGEIHG